MDEIRISIGKKARLLRAIKGISQEAMALHLGISQQAYQKIESGETRVSIVKAIRIAEGLEMDFDGFFNSAPNTYGQSQADELRTSHANHFQQELIQSLKDQIRHLTAEVEFLRIELRKKDTIHSELQPNFPIKNNVAIVR